MRSYTLYTLFLAVLATLVSGSAPAARAAMGAKNILSRVGQIAPHYPGLIPKKGAINIERDLSNIITVGQTVVDGVQKMGQEVHQGPRYVPVNPTTKSKLPFPKMESADTTVKAQYPNIDFTKVYDFIGAKE